MIERLTPAHFDEKFGITTAKTNLPEWSKMCRRHARSALTSGVFEGYVPRSIWLSAISQRSPGQVGKKKNRHKVLL